MGLAAAHCLRMLDASFPTVPIGPAPSLAYWHFRLVGELLAASGTPKSVNVLQATTKLYELLATMHTFVSPVTHYFTVITALGMIELLRFPETRDVGANLIREFVTYKFAKSPWDVVVRNKLKRYLALHVPSAQGHNAASAVASNGSDTTPAPDGLTAAEPTKENSDPAAGANQPQDIHPSGETQSEAPAPERLDVQALLTGGYFSWFTEGENDQPLFN